MMNKPRVRQPYKRKTFSKGGAVIFGVGLGALLVTIIIVGGVVLPHLSSRLDNLSYRARTYYRKLMPHPEYLPAPASVAVDPAGAEHPNASLPPVNVPPPADEAILLESASPPTAPAHATPAALNPAPDGLEIDQNLLLPSPPSIEVSLAAVERSAQLAGFSHQWQTWNNCGPATITTHMSYFGRAENQVDAAQFLKPNRDDKNVSPHELAAYVRTTGMGVVVRQHGSIDQLKTFISNNFPVLLETWLIHDGDGLGHYRLVTGYDDETGKFTTTDSLNGPEFQVSYEQLDNDWRVFNRLYLVVYPLEQEPVVQTIIGEDMDDTVMYEWLLAEAKSESEANPNDAIAFFNQGEALTRLGLPQDAVLAFDRARQLGLHWRRLWYQFTPFEAYYAVGRYEDVLDLAEATLKGTGGLEEAYYYRGMALKAIGRSGAVEDFQAALTYNPNFSPAAVALSGINESP